MLSYFSFRKVDVYTMTSVILKIYRRVINWVLGFNETIVNLPKLVPAITRDFGMVKYSVLDGCQVAECIVR